MTHEEAIEYYYAKGKEDYPEYDPPESDINIIGDIAVSISDKETAISRAYSEGWNHAKNQAGK